MDIRKLVLKAIPSGMKIVDFEDESIKHLSFIGLLLVLVLQPAVLVMAVWF